MIHTLALTPFLGIPALAVGGILTFLLLLSTATIGILNMKGITIIPLKWHFRLAFATITLAVIHAIFGLSISLNF
jgi:hypothetical protein